MPDFIDTTTSQQVNHRRGNNYATLSTLVDSRQLSAPAAGQIVINFPAMPETLELARSAVYQNSARTPVTPDGFHIYEATEPLRIPLRFSLSAYDKDYCQQDGPYALLLLGAKLHALLMPIVPGGQNAFGDLTRVTPASTPGGSDADLVSRNVVTGQSSFDVGKSAGQFYFPPPCRLSLILAEFPGKGNMGIACSGFVERVNVTYRGPWLQWDFSGDSGRRNLPAAADFDFTFVHQPGYTNKFIDSSGNFSVVPSATTAADIYHRFYNEVSVSQRDVVYANIFGNVTPSGT